MSVHRIVRFDWLGEEPTFNQFTVYEAQLRRRTAYQYAILAHPTGTAAKICESNLLIDPPIVRPVPGGFIEKF